MSKPDGVGDDDPPPAPPEMIDHALLATVAMWVGKVAGKETIRIMC